MTPKPNPKFLIRRLLSGPDSGRILRSHRWLDEVRRWEELAAALFSVVLRMPNARLHVLVSQLRAQNLLDVATWCQTSTDFAEARHEDVVEEFLLVVEDAGVAEEQRVRCARAFHQLAHKLGERFEGKVQLALREVGNDALDKLQASFRLTEVSDREARETLTIWLQNVANLPVTLRKASLETFSKENGVTSDKLIDAADDLDLTLAALDDLIEHWHEVRAALKAAQVEKTGRSA